MSQSQEDEKHVKVSLLPTVSADNSIVYHRCCRSINSVSWFVFFCCVLNFLEGYAVNGITNINIPAFELQFQLPSSRSGLIASATNIGALTLVLFVSYVGTSYHKPIWTGCGAIVMAIGSLVFMIPHWTAGNYEYPAKSTPDIFCSSARNVTSPPSSPTDDSPYLGIFMLGNALHGAGYTPLYTLAIAYIEENESFQRAGFHVGLFYASAAVGVAVGFLAGGQFLQYYVDFDRVDMSSIDISPRDFGYWVGAWWLGYIVSIVGFVLFALPLFGYPKHMKDYKLDQKTVAENQEQGKSGTAVKTFKGFCLAFVRLFRNPTFVFLTLGATCMGMIINGISSFSAKYLLEQFAIPVDIIGYILGGLIIVGSGGGMALGGIFVRILRLELRGMIRLCLICIVIGGLSGLALLVKCPEIDLVGLKTPYTNQSDMGFNASCNMDCSCEAVRFGPVCGSDSLVYFSTCHAGCSQPVSPVQYSNCSCVIESEEASGMASRGLSDFGRCEDDCQMIYVLVPFLLVMFLAVFLITTPVSMATLRCVQEDLRPFALGVQWTVMRLLGFIPGPVFIGYVIDQSCLLWSRGQDQGVCLLYQKEDMSLYVAIWWIAMTFMAMIFFIIVMIITERRVSKEHAVSSR